MRRNRRHAGIPPLVWLNGRPHLTVNFRGTCLPLETGGAVNGEAV
jgi:hypothetical protein